MKSFSDYELVELAQVLAGELMWAHQNGFKKEIRKLERQLRRIKKESDSRRKTLLGMW